MSTRALDEVEGKAVAAYLIKEGAQPQVVSGLTGTTLHFAQRLASELASPRKMAFDRSRLWATPVRFTQTSLFGMCLQRMRVARGDQLDLAVVVEAYKLYHYLAALVIGHRQEKFTAHEALLFYSAYVEGAVISVRCHRCRAGLWRPRARERFRCPVCLSGNAAPPALMKG
jgi:hypothetical protein